MGPVLTGLELMSDDRYDAFVGGDDLLGFESRHLEVTSDRRRGLGLLRMAWHGRRPVEDDRPWSGLEERWNQSGDGVVPWRSDCRG
jgi:hypothetical protein